MHVRDYLHDIPLKALKSIAATLNVTVEYQARIKLINAIDRAFWDGTLIEKLFENLSEDRRRLLSMIAFSYDVGVPEKILLRKAERVIGINKKTFSEQVDDLIMLSLVGGITHEQQNIYFCPSGIAEQIRKNYIKDIIEPASESIPVPSASPPNLLEDMYAFLAVAYKEGVPLTLMGKIKKNVFDKAFADSQTCLNGKEPFSENIRNTFIVDYLKDRELLTYDRQKAVASVHLHGWLDLSMSARFQDIVSFALLSVLKDDYAAYALPGIIAESPAGSLFDIGKIVYFLHVGTMSGGGFSNIETKVRTMLNVFCQLGLFSFYNTQFVLTVTGEQFFRGEPVLMDSAVSEHFTTQPNFEIIVGHEIDPRIRFQLELLTTRKNRDMVLTYIINREGIVRARERGMSSDEIVSFFIKHSRNPIPQNVQFSIETWAGEYGSIYFEKTTLMRCRDEATCNSIVHIPELAPYIIERLSERVLVISSDNITKVTAELKKSGYQPEQYGISNQPPDRSARPYSPKTIQSLREKYKIPGIHTEFIFPEPNPEEDESAP